MAIKPLSPGKAPLYPLLPGKKQKPPIGKRGPLYPLLLKPPTRSIKSLYLTGKYKRKKLNNKLK
jgi:hypothetical protein